MKWSARGAGVREASQCTPCSVMYQVFIDVMQLWAHLQRAGGCNHARLQRCDEGQRLATCGVKLQPADLWTYRLHDMRTCAHCQMHTTFSFLHCGPLIGSRVLSDSSRACGLLTGCASSFMLRLQVPRWRRAHTAARGHPGPPRRRCRFLLLPRCQLPPPHPAASPPAIRKLHSGHWGMQFRVCNTNPCRGCRVLGILPICASSGHGILMTRCTSLVDHSAPVSACRSPSTCRSGSARRSPKCMQILYLGHDMRGVLHELQHRARRRDVRPALQPALYRLQLSADCRRHAAQLLLRSSTLGP